jgi:mono/diheme cytochrome c family protein
MEEDGMGRAPRACVCSRTVNPCETPMHRTAAALLSLFLFAAPGAAWAANAGNGKTLAERWCATCHVVSSDQKKGNTQAPPFSAVAKKPGLTAAQLALFLLNPHPKMPDMNLTRTEAADLAAYIVSLK